MLLDQGMCVMRDLLLQTEAYRAHRVICPFGFGDIFFSSVLRYYNNLFGDRQLSWLRMWKHRNVGRISFKT